MFTEAQMNDSFAKLFGGVNSTAKNMINQRDKDELKVEMKKQADAERAKEQSREEWANNLLFGSTLPQDQQAPFFNRYAKSRISKTPFNPLDQANDVLNGAPVQPASAPKTLPSSPAISNMNQSPTFPNYTNPYLDIFKPLFGGK